MKIISADITGSLIINNQDVTTTVESSSIWSGSIASRVTNLEQFSSSLDATFATDQQLNQATASLSGSIALLSSSYLATSQSYDIVSSSFSQVSGSFVTVSSSYSIASGSLSTRVTTLEAASASLNTASSSLSTRATNIEGNYATTGSNIFTGAQTVCANITSTGTIIAQTLNVQQVTSSIVYSSGSNIFGCSLANTQQFTGSVLVTGSLTVTTAGTSPEFQVLTGGTIKGNALTDVHSVSGSLRVTGSGNHWFQSGCVGIGTTTPTARLHVGSGNQGTINGADTKIHIANSGLAGRAALLTIASDCAGNCIEGQFESSAETFADSRVILGSTSNHPLVIRTNNSERIRVTNTGLVGIGCSAPTYHLEVRCAASVSSCYYAAMFARSTGANDGIGDIIAFGANGVSSIGGIYRAGASSWGIELQTASGNTRMRIDNSGITTFCCQICAPFYAGGTSYAIDFLVVGGGGGGGGAEMSNGFGGGGGAGGAGGYLASSISVNCGSSYPITVGTGGVGGCSRLAADGSGLPGCPGTFSSAFGFIAIGGGAGAGDEGTAANNATCTVGGSGGGQGGDGGGCLGIAVIGQGCNGGTGAGRTGGGGGGASATGNNGGSGGAGRQWLDGCFYAGGGGGGGGGNNQTLSVGGNGGGGTGSRAYSGGGTSGEPGGQSTAGCPNTGGGGGGAGAGYLQGGQCGGSGIVVIRYFGPTRASGGTISSCAGYTYHRFTSGGTFTA